MTQLFYQHLGTPIGGYNLVMVCERGVELWYVTQRTVDDPDHLTMVRCYSNRRDAEAFIRHAEREVA